MMLRGESNASQYSRPLLSYTESVLNTRDFQSLVTGRVSSSKLIREHVIHDAVIKPLPIYSMSKITKTQGLQGAQQDAHAALGTRVLTAPIMRMSIM